MLSDELNELFFVMPQEFIVGAKPKLPIAQNVPGNYNGFCVLFVLVNIMFAMYLEQGKTNCINLFFSRRGILFDFLALLYSMYIYCIYMDIYRYALW